MPFSETGTVHAIGGLVIAEIQQTSDITQIMILIEKMQMVKHENSMLT
jgi:mannose-6-phosphate isomerase class I